MHIEKSLSKDDIKALVSAKYNETGNIPNSRMLGIPTSQIYKFWNSYSELLSEIGLVGIKKTKNKLSDDELLSLLKCELIRIKTLSANMFIKHKSPIVPTYSFYLRHFRKGWEEILKLINISYNDIYNREEVLSKLVAVRMSTKERISDPGEFERQIGIPQSIVCKLFNKKRIINVWHLAEAELRNIENANINTPMHIRDILKMLNIPHNHLAKELGVKRQYVQAWCDNKISISPRYLNAISSKLNIKMELILSSTNYYEKNIN